MNSDLKAEIQRLSEAIQELTEKHAQAREALAEQWAKFKRGEVICWATRSGTRTGEVIGHRMITGDLVSYQVKSLRKDGLEGALVEVPPWKQIWKLDEA